MPSQLWPLFKENYALLGQLSALAAKPVLEVARQKGLLPGIFTALHTFGRDLKYNVHVHLSVTRGGISNDQSTWKTLYFAKRLVMPQWRYGVITLLRQAYQQGQLTLPPALLARCPTQTSTARPIAPPALRRPHGHLYLPQSHHRASSNPHRAE